MQWLTAESARILHTVTLRHIDADDATEVLRALWRVRGLLDGLIQPAQPHMLWTWQDLFKVWHRIASVVVTIHWHNSIFSRPLSNNGVYAC